MSVSPIYISGEAKPDHVLPSFIENGAPPHLLERSAPAAYSAVALFASSSEFVCSYIGGNSLRSFSGAGGYHDPLHWYRLCAVMGTRQRFPEVRTAFGAYPDICKMSSGYTSLLEWGLKGRSPFCKLGHVLAHDMLAFPISSKARNRKVLRCPSIRLAKARQLRLAFV